MITYVTYSGADAMPFYGGEKIPEVSNITYTHDFYEMVTPIKGHIDVCIFGEDSSLIKQIRKVGPSDTFTIEFASEYGQRSVAEFKKINFTHRTSKLEVDDIVEMERYHFTASDVVRRMISPAIRSLSDEIEVDLKAEPKEDKAECAEDMKELQQDA